MTESALQLQRVQAKETLEAMNENFKEKEGGAGVTMLIEVVVVVYCYVRAMHTASEANYIQAN